jgi:putative FmdB family regulatory protein
MPTYTFRCEKCSAELERIVKIDDRDNQNCESCDSKLVRGIDRPGAVWAPTSSSGGLKV